MAKEILEIMSLSASITSLQHMYPDTVIDLATDTVNDYGYPIIATAHYYILGVAYLMAGKPHLSTKYIKCIPDKIYANKLQQLLQTQDYQTLQLSLHVLDNKLRLLADELANTKYPEYRQ